MAKHCKCFYYLQRKGGNNALVDFVTDTYLCLFVLAVIADKDDWDENKITESIASSWSNSPWSIWSQCIALLK